MIYERHLHFIFRIWRKTCLELGAKRILNHGNLCARWIPKELSGVQLSWTSDKLCCNPILCRLHLEYSNIIWIHFSSWCRKFSALNKNIETDIVLQSYANEKNDWKPVDGMKYHLLRGTALRVNSRFGKPISVSHSFQAWKKFNQNMDRDSHTLISTTVCELQRHCLPQIWRYWEG
jgi:hypothetical protein